MLCNLLFFSVETKNSSVVATVHLVLNSQRIWCELLKLAVSGVVLTLHKQK